MTRTNGPGGNGGKGKGKKPDLKLVKPTSDAEPQPVDAQAPVEEADAVILEPGQAEPPEGEWEPMALEEQAQRVRDEMVPAAAGFKALEGPTREWHRRVLYAYLRLLTVPQNVACLVVGRADRTVREWEEHESYPQAQAEARDMYGPEVEAMAMATLAHSLRKGLGVGRGKADDGRLALEVLARVRREFSPVAPRPSGGKEGDAGAEGDLEPTGAVRDRLLGRLAGISGRLLTGGDAGPAGDNGGRPTSP